MSSYSDIVAGTPLVWKASGGDKVLTLTSLAHTSNGTRQGDKSATLVNTQYGLPEYLELYFVTKFGSAPTNGDEIQIYIGESDNATAGTSNPGTLTGADATLSNPTEIVKQLNFVGSLIASNGTGTGAQNQRFRYKPVCAYIIPVVLNAAAQDLSGTAGDHSLTITPYYRRAPI
jgi:hypothetical protein